MQHVGAARPNLISSVSKLCRYSSDKPVKPRQLVTEWQGIVIPSRTEINERQKAPRREEIKTDLSYLKNAPSNSLAARLARRKEAASAQPKPQAKVETISPEALELATQRRRELRIARETAEANAALRRFTPNATLSKSLETVAANYRPAPTMSRNAPSFENVAKSRNAYTRRDSNAPQRASSEGRQYGRTSDVRAPSAGPAKLDTSSKAEEVAETESQETAAFEDLDADQEEALLGDYPTLAETSQSDLTLVNADHNKSRRDRVSAGLLKRTQQRLRDGLIDESQVPKELKGEMRQAFKPQSKSTLNQAHLNSIEKRRQARLLREQAAGNTEMFRNHEQDNYPSNKRRTKPRKGPNTRLIQENDDEGDFGEQLLAVEEEEDPAYLTSPEPVSLTLEDILRQPNVRSSGRLSRESYSLYVPESTATLFSVPAGERSAVDMANVALSHRADIPIPKRQTAIDLIAAATRPRSITGQATAQ